MPRKKTDAQLLKEPKHKYTQCDFYLKPKLSKGSQVDLSLVSESKLETVKIKKKIKTKSCASQTEGRTSQTESRSSQTESQSFSDNDEEPLPPPIYVKHVAAQCNFFIKPMCSRFTQIEPELLFHNDHKLNEIPLNTLKRKGDETFLDDSNLAPKRFIAEISGLIETDSTSIINFEIARESDEITALKAIEDYIKTLSGFNISITRDRDRCLSQLEVTRDDTMIASSNYLYSPIKLLFSISGFMTKAILFKEATQDIAFTSEDKKVDFEIVKKALSSLSTDHVFCPGISAEDCRNFNTKNLENIKYPFERHQSVECSVWFTPPSNSPKDNFQSGVYKCGKCRLLNSYILKERRRKTNTTPRTKLKRVSASSNCKISILSPKSRSKRFYNNRCLRGKLNKKIKQLEAKIVEASVHLNEEQHKKMQDVIAAINSKDKQLLEQIFNEAGENNKLLGIALKRAWKLDTERNEFENDQKRNKKGSRGNRWSTLTYRIALSVFSRSPAAYEALASFEVLKLPSVHTLRSKVCEIKMKQGIDLQHLKCEADNFREYAVNYPGINKPPAEGAIIFDEVKVIGKVIWNSNSNEFIGCALDANDLPSIGDMYKENTLSETLEGEYVLQYLWRCIAGSFDIIGPFFMLSKPASASVITDTLFKVLWAFQSVGLETSALVCDGGSCNVTALRHTLGRDTPFGNSENEDGSFNFTIEPKFKHPFLKDRFINWIVCPTHQLKNMINGLHHSQVGGSKDFTILGNIQFGWEQIINMYDREVSRRDSHELAQVKGLCLSYIERDSWTKLNVVPAKIMQDLKVLGELYNYANPKSESPPDDRDSVMACHDFLYACHLIFEKGLLSHDKVDSMDAAPIKSMKKGLEFFECWATERLLCEENLKIQTGQKFLAWQTWELLRICVFGFCGLAEDFITRNPSKYIYPVRINGSAIETIFSQLKYISGSKLTSMNYAPGVRALLIKNCTKTSQNAESNYRKIGLDIFQVSK